MELSVPLDVATRVAGLLLVFLVGFWWVTSRNPNIQTVIKVNIVKNTGPVEMYAAQQWYSRLFIPYEKYVPKELANWKNCDFRIKNQEDLSREMEKVTKCKMEVALGLTMWEYILDETENVDLSEKLAEYNIPEDIISEMEQTIHEQVSTLKDKEGNEKKVALAISAEIVKSKAETLGEMWFRKARGGK